TVEDLLDLGSEAPVPNISEVSLNETAATDSKQPEQRLESEDTQQQVAAAEEESGGEDQPPLESVGAEESAEEAVAIATESANGDEFGSRMSSGNGSVGQGQGGGADSCKMCHGRVYPMERLTSDGQVYHKSCYRCYKCKRQLSVGNFAIMDDRLYCQPHYIELFRLKGSYRFHDSAGVPVNSIAGSGDESVENGGGSNDSGHVPKLSNIKSRFESFEEQPPASPSKRKEKVYYAGLQSARHRYETATSEKERPHSEKPKRFTPPREGSAGVVESQPQELPPDVVRCYDNGDSDDRPAPGSSRNVLARFREIEQQNGNHQPPAKEAEARPRSPPVSKPQQPRQQQQQLDFDYSAPVSDATVSESQPTPLPDGVVRSGAPTPPTSCRRPTPPARRCSCGAAKRRRWTRRAHRIPRLPSGASASCGTAPGSSARRRQTAMSACHSARSRNAATAMTRATARSSAKA
ncbi:hypothetical protein BOX15_Mlig024286g1, partial [Macrostomum lignano]